jgi:hypothetical protein
VVAEEGEEKNSDGLREVRGEGVEAEEAKAEGDEPVGERRFFEVTDAVNAEGDEVAGDGHVAGGAGVSGVGVVEQRRSEEGGEEDDQPKAGKDEESGAMAGGADVPCGRGWGECFEESLVGHELLVLFQHKWVRRQIACVGYRMHGVEWPGM